MPIPAPYRLDLGFPNWFLAGTEDDTERAPVPAKVDRLLVPEQVEAIVEVGLPVPRVAFERAAHLRGRIGRDRGALFVEPERDLRTCARQNDVGVDVGVAHDVGTDDVDLVFVDDEPLPHGA